MILKDFGAEKGLWRGKRGALDDSGTKKCGVGNGDPNLRSQPRLPGSVVGEPSMRQAGKAGKITRVTVL
jgi:hypothetical protein